jgi:hypothetical protein
MSNEAYPGRSGGKAKRGHTQQDFFGYTLYIGLFDA